MPQVMLVCILVVFLFAACDESLPPRTESRAALKYAAVSNGSYVMVQSGRVMTSDMINLSATNIYDDVLSDDLHIVGTLHLRLRDAPGAQRMLTYSQDDIWTQVMISGNTLTMRPGQTIAVAHPWDHRTDDGTPFWTYLRVHRDTTGSGRVYFRSDTAWFEASGSLQVFEKSPAGKISVYLFPTVYTLFDTIIDTTTAPDK
jgi:hypothetical protein